MAFAGISIGDILMLSQLSWKIGCAFTAGRSGAPSQFQEVENELKSLTTAITLLAESIDEDGGLLARSDAKTREGLDKILVFEERSTSDEGFVRLTLPSLRAVVDKPSILLTLSLPSTKRSEDRMKRVGWPHVDPGDRSW